MMTWRRFKHRLARWLCKLLDYDPPPKGILWPFPTVSGGSFDAQPAVQAPAPPPGIAYTNFQPDIVLSINNTLNLAANNVYSMKFPQGNKAHIANIGAGKVWFRVDGQNTSVNDTQSEMLPPGVADNDISVSSFVSMVSDVGATVVIRCHY